MVIGLLQVAIRLPESHSLKEKRWIVKSLVTRIRNQFNVSISEIAAQDSWQRATLAASHVGTDRRHTNEILDRLLRFVEEVKKIEVIDSKLELL